MQSDSSSRFLMANADLRGYLLQLNETYADSLSATDYPLPIRILLGEFLAAAALLSETIKFKGRLLLQVKGLEKITLLAAEASSERSLRCVARFQDLSDGDAQILKLCSAMARWSSRSSPSMASATKAWCR